MQAKDGWNFERDHIEDISKETMKKLTWFFLCTQSPFIDKIMKNKSVELVISLSLSCKTCLDKFALWSDLLNLETVERNRKNWQNIQYLKNEKSFLEERKTIFHNFWNVFFR